MKAASPATSLPGGVRTFPTLSTAQESFEIVHIATPKTPKWKPPRVQSYVEVKCGPLLRLPFQWKTERRPQRAADIYLRPCTGPRCTRPCAERFRWVISLHSYDTPLRYILVVSSPPYKRGNSHSGSLNNSVPVTRPGVEGGSNPGCLGQSL